MKTITCYETADGKVCRTEGEALRHEALSAAHRAVEDLVEGLVGSDQGIIGSENRAQTVEFIMNHRKAIFEILSTLALNS